MSDLVFIWSTISILLLFPKVCVRHAICVLKRSMLALFAKLSFEPFLTPLSTKIGLKIKIIVFCLLFEGGL